MTQTIQNVSMILILSFFSVACGKSSPKKFHKKGGGELVEPSEPVPPEDPGNPSEPSDPPGEGTQPLDEDVSESIGYYTSGCVRGDLNLSDYDGNFELVNTFRDRHWAHARSVNFVAYFTDRLLEEGVETVKISDISKARGGSLRPGHASHQMGLDLDIWLANGEDTYQSVVYNSQVNETLFERFQARKLYKAAVDYQDVQRVFVNYAIKQHLCRTEEERAWLRKLRPISGHTGHLHVRMYCTEHDPECQPQSEVAPGSGCSEVLSEDFDPYFYAEELGALDQQYEQQSPSRCHQ